MSKNLYEQKLDTIFGVLKTSRVFSHIVANFWHKQKPLVSGATEIAVSVGVKSGGGF